MFALATERPVLTALAVLFLAWVARFLRKGYNVRRTFHNQPGPPHSWLWGHLRVMGDMMNGDLPTTVHPHVLPARIREKYKLGSHFYMDLWPVADPFLAVFDPDLAAQFTTEHSFPKYRGIKDFMMPLAGHGDIVSSDGPHWKKWRSIFNPGFASKHLMTLVPGIVDYVEIFTDKLSGLSRKQEPFRLEEMTTRLTVDIIGKVALDMELNTQTGNNPMISALREQVHLVPNSGTLNPFAGWSPIGIYKRWKNSRIMVSYLDKVLEDRLANQEGGQGDEKQPRKRTMIDLALESYLSQASPTATTTAGLDPNFKTNAITQIRIFIFAGHDTTSSAICYALYLLQKHPSTLARLRAEHDNILGPDPATAASTIKVDPYILNKLEYTTAVLKESLRLFPAASGLRAPEPTLPLRNPKTGENLPTVPHMLLWIPHWGMHRDKTLWGDSADSFNPSRFLPENASRLPEAAYRPFERGVRNCIGQDLAMLEGRIVLALVARRYDFKPAFEALDMEVLLGDGSKYAENERWRSGKQDLDGEVAYPVLIGSAKPREGMPVWVSEREG